MTQNKSNNPHRIAYVVPTMDRPDDLRVLFNSLQAQTIFPHQIIIVDGSNPDIKYVCDEYPNLPITYERCFPPSLAKQRNAGMAQLQDDITLAGYLDDDIELDPDATEKMLAFWADAPENTGGAAIAIRDQYAQLNSKLMSFFLMAGDNPGQMLPSAYAVHLPFIGETFETKWLYGGATIWTRNVIDTFEYDEWFAGYGFLEDVDYSFRVGQKHQLYVVGDSQCLHHSVGLSNSKQYIFGKQQIYNRLYFARKMKTFSFWAVYWAIFGNILMNTVALLKNHNRSTWDRLMGNFVGLWAALKGNTQSIGGFWK
jgi:GT2 family glycosyltransferase